LAISLSTNYPTSTSCLNFDFAILNLFEPSAPWSDGPEVEHGAHFLILYYPTSTITGSHTFTTSGTGTLMSQHQLHHVDESTPTALHCL
jgi:hypothetical protein